MAIIGQILGWIALIILPILVFFITHEILIKEVSDYETKDIFISIINVLLASIFTRLFWVHNFWIALGITIIVAIAVVLLWRVATRIPNYYLLHPYLNLLILIEITGAGIISSGLLSTVLDKKYQILILVFISCVSMIDYIIKERNISIRVEKRLTRNLDKPQGKQNINSLLKALRYQEKWYIRRRAADALGNTGSKRAVKPLIQALYDKNRDVCTSAAAALKKIGKPSVKPLITALEKPDTAINITAASLLGEIGDTRAVTPLIRVLCHKDSGVRSSAAASLKKIGEPAVKPLIAALRNTDLIVSRTAASLLGEIGDTRAVMPLIKILNAEHGSIRATVAISLGQLGDDRAIEPLIQVLGDKDVNVRKVVVKILGETGDERIIEPLIQMLKDTDNSIREMVVSILRQIKDERIIEPIVQMLKDPNDNVRVMAVNALEHIEDKRIIKPLVQALQDENIYIRRMSAMTLANFGDIHAIEPLIEALQDNSEEVRKTAAAALKKFGNKLNVESFIKILQDKNADTRKFAAQTLDYLEWEPGSDENAAWYWIAKEDWDQCATIGEPAVMPLIKLLAHKNYKMKTDVIRLLGKLGDHRAVEPLIKVSAYDPETVAEALGQLGDEHAIEPLIEMLKHSSHASRKAAAHALVKIYQANPNGSSRKKILAVRKVITAQHADGMKNIHYDESYNQSSDCTHNDNPYNHQAHSDEGIGIEFPI